MSSSVSKDSSITTNLEHNGSISVSISDEEVILDDDFLKQNNIFSQIDHTLNTHEASNQVEQIETTFSMKHSEDGVSVESIECAHIGERSQDSEDRYHRTKSGVRDQSSRSKMVPSSPRPHNCKSKEFFIKFDSCNTPLHSSLIVHSSSQEILQQLSDYPEYAFIANKAGDLPLHYAAMDKQIVDEEVLDLLVQSNPLACSHFNSDRSLPLHLHCMIGAPSLSFVKKMLHVFPSGASVQSEIAVANKNAQKDLQITETAMNQLCMFLDVEDIFKFLKGNSYRSEISKTNLSLEVGWSPLHLAVYNGAPIEVIQEILRVAPKSAKLRTSRNRTALDCGRAILATLENYQITRERSKSEVRMLSLMKQNALNTKLAVNLLNKFRE